MEALLLCAGKGTRLHPLTLHYPKAVVPILGIPFIAYQIMQLANYGINRIHINIYHNHESVMKQAHKYCPKGVEIIYHNEYYNNKSILGTGGAISSVSRHVKDDLLLVKNVDILSSIDIIPGLEIMNSSNASVCLFIADPYPYFSGNMLSLSDDGQWLNFLGTSNRESKSHSTVCNGIFSGLQIIRTSIAKEWPVECFDAFRRYYKEWIKEGAHPICGIYSPEQLLDMGDWVGLMNTHKSLFQALIKRRFPFHEKMRNLVLEPMVEFSENCYIHESIKDKANKLKNIKAPLWIESYEPQLEREKITYGPYYISYNMDNYQSNYPNNLTNNCLYKQNMRENTIIYGNIGVRGITDTTYDVYNPY